MCATVGLHWVSAAGLFIALHVFHASATVGWAVLVFIFIPVPWVLKRRWDSGKWKQMSRPPAMAEIEIAENIQPFRDL
jgi:hypothetical protein